ncbi:P-loop containing nucleoside triphosphate hydrolase protein [Rhizophagus diaphanus]|nr:P-loop containing nucleoside triphosphate hydrolase protein [Rhizophagus diaphanus] [Rhizophagus sp. MUCL 43196]
MNRKNLRKEDLDKYEKKLLTCVVDPENILVGFSDIHVAQSIVQTLQTLITLPLMRPQSFSYGVLSKHFISGVLLFGPPGTGKTMLAKAVAKESGSTVIDIKSSDVYDMYVGEGEKNVRAIFSLARKLSPCVIFLDELDAIFGSRHSDIHNGAHREIINQFMTEWDGLTSRNDGVLIMGATNRPFDLDDAILRRMPRRILVDLPNEKDREQILHLHLRDEKLDSLISLNHLAKSTKFYSGSDLKNLCISAALAAVREDAESEKARVINNVNKIDKNNDDLKKNNTEQSLHVRVLKEHHFQVALKQVTPSCSEDMSSLIELRKWDGMYGDGAWNRKKRVKGIGFYDTVNISYKNQEL